MPARVWVLCGDSEMAEGSIWEAFDHASFWKLDNLIAIVDVNRLGQTGETMHGWDLDVYAERRARASAGRRSRSTVTTSRPIEDAYARAEAAPRAAHRDPGPHQEGRRASQPSRTCRTATASRSRTPTPRSRSWAARATSPSRSRRPSGSSRTDSRPQAASARASSSATRSPPARRTARRSRPSATHAATWWRSTARSRTRPTASSSARPIRSASSRPTSPSSSSWPPPSGCSGAAGSRSPPRSRRSSRVRTTSCGWPLSAGRTCGCAAPMPACRSARTGPPRWAWRTWLRSERSTPARCSTPPTPTRRCGWSS